jgi:hypothetical protein
MRASCAEVVVSIVQMHFVPYDLLTHSLVTYMCRFYSCNWLGRFWSIPIYFLPLSVPCWSGFVDMDRIRWEWEVFVTWMHFHGVTVLVKDYLIFLCLGGSSKLMHIYWIQCRGTTKNVELCSTLLSLFSLLYLTEEILYSNPGSLLKLQSHNSWCKSSCNSEFKWRHGSDGLPIHASLHSARVCAG